MARAMTTDVRQGGRAWAAAVVVASLAAGVVCGREPLWQPGAPGLRMGPFTCNNDGEHRRITWTADAGFLVELDAERVYDGRDERSAPPEVRIDLRGERAHLSGRDFVLSARTEVGRGRGEWFHGGIFVGFAGGKRLLFGPRGRDALRFGMAGARGGVTAEHSRFAAHLKLKRRGARYTAWFSPEGRFWRRLGSVTITERPLSVGAMLMNRGLPHAERMAFAYFDVTHVDGEPERYKPNVIYGETDEEALHFTYNVSGVDVLFRLMVRRADGNRAEPNNSKFYFIHGSSHDDEGPFHALRWFSSICSDLLRRDEESYHRANALVVAPRFPRGRRPWPKSHGFHYQTLRGEEDRLLIDLHEDFIRERFPADRPETDDRFALMGHSGGGQFAARFAMAHPRKLYQVVVSSPATYAFPTRAVDWPLGLAISESFHADAPRLTLDAKAAFDLPIQLVVGENDSLMDRGAEEERYEPTPLTYSRVDGARKWVRQMAKASGGKARAVLHICPAVGHAFTAEKRWLALTLLLGSQGERARAGKWRYAFELGAADEETSVAPARIPDRLFAYFKFNRFRMPRGDHFARYEFRAEGVCRVTDRNGQATGTREWALVRNRRRIQLTVGDEEFTQPTVAYGALRLYSDDLRVMIEQSQAVTPLFIKEQVVGRPLYLYRGSGRGPDGPQAVRFAAGAFQLNPDGSVTHAGTRRLYARDTMRRWRYDEERHLLRFSGMGQGELDPVQIGQWRWGVRPDGGTFLAGLSTSDDGDGPRMEVQSDARYDPAYFERWDTGPEQWPAPDWTPGSVGSSAPLEYHGGPNAVAPE